MIMLADTQESIVLELENIGCLKKLTLEIKPGLNIISAPNASGKTTIIRGLSCMFSDRIPPSHVLALDETNGRIRAYYRGGIYEKTLRRTPSGEVIAQGSMLPFADARALDACVALAETGVVHKITGGSSVFRRYLEDLSYGSYYSAIIDAAQELIDEYGRKLASSKFRDFESLPILLTELTDLHIRREEIQRRVEDLKSAHNSRIRKLREEIDAKASALSREEADLSQLERNLSIEADREKQLLDLLRLADESSEIAANISNGISSSRRRQEIIRREIEEKRRIVDGLRVELEDLRKSLRREEMEGPRSLQSLQKELERVNKLIVLKEEEIQRAERFPPDDDEYPGMLVVEVRSEILKRIEWLEMVSGYFQEKYMRRMTSARRRFNSNIRRAFRELELKGFENIFLDQNFALHVVREGNIRQPIETLSASEKLTISLMLMLAAKETFLPDFPLFIVDELTLSYDPDRFWRIMNYIKERVPYVIVTSLSSKPTDKIEISYRR